MAKVTVQVTHKELDDLENLTLVWNLCKKHNGILNASEEDMFRFTQECRQCRKINKEITNSTLHLWSKLVSAYLKATKHRDKSQSKKK